jgi:hypothetical protein
VATRLPILLCAALAACLLGTVSLAEARPAAEPLRVLFVGNSLTATNDLPAEVARLARAAGKQIETGTVVHGGFSLDDHWNQGDVRAALATGSWDLAIMQQGPSALPDSQAQLRTSFARLAAEARAAGTQPALLTVWPESYRRNALPEVMASYRGAAREAGATVYPAGDAWLRAWQCNSRLVLYGRDGFHPSRTGTYLAALVVHGRLFRASVRGRAVHLPGAKPKVARLLQASAATTLGRWVPVAERCGAK